MCLGISEFAYFGHSPSYWMHPEKFLRKSDDRAKKIGLLLSRLVRPKRAKSALTLGVRPNLVWIFDVPLDKSAGSTEIDLELPLDLVAPYTGLNERHWRAALS